MSVITILPAAEGFAVVGSGFISAGPLTDSFNLQSGMFNAYSGVTFDIPATKIVSAELDFYAIGNAGTITPPYPGPTTPGSNPSILMGILAIPIRSYPGPVNSLATVQAAEAELSEFAGAQPAGQASVSNSLTAEQIPFSGVALASLQSAAASGDGAFTIALHLGADGSQTGYPFNSEMVAGFSIKIVTSDVACFVRGTLITTEYGEVEVQCLSIGDEVLLSSGLTAPIRWIGYRSYGGRFLYSNKSVRPIRFRAGSLGMGLPKRDLLVSPKHAMFLNGILIPAEALVNGATIMPDLGHDHVEYYHIELDKHSLVMAEGSIIETFIDDGSRGVFHNAAEYEEKYDLPGEHIACYCVPRMDSGFAVELIRAKLMVVAEATPKVA